MKRPQDIQRVFKIALTENEYEALFAGNDEQMGDYMMDIEGVEWANYDGEAIHFGVPSTTDQTAAANRVYEELRGLLGRALGEDLDYGDLECLPDVVKQAGRENTWGAHDISGYLIRFIASGGASAYRTSKPFNAEGVVLRAFLEGAFQQGQDPDDSFSPVLVRAIAEQGWSAQRCLRAGMDFLDSSLEPSIQSDWKETFIDFARREMALEDARSAEWRAGGYQPR
jgi:hypothetical protein